MESRHAYLIMAHRNPAQVGKLLCALDDPRNDIFLHVDIKYFEQFDLEELHRLVKHASLSVTHQLDLKWGGYEQVQCAFDLLEQACQEPHAYYHLLSGQCYPLRSQQDIHAFFDAAEGKEFVHFCPQESWQPRAERMLGLKDSSRAKKRGVLGRLFAKGGGDAVRSMPNNDAVDQVRYGYGSQWWSITHALAQDIVEHRAWFDEHFSSGKIVDELVMQSFVLTFIPQDRLAVPATQSTMLANRRYIEWTKGDSHPKIIAFDDVPRVAASQCLFARKVDEVAVPGIVEALEELW